ncbi:hypothetical protein Bbelb_416350 [Branchiostoma belcheri]|nr:hypothetical protein Bbelb_416350 [Branchiostoma belcheri]
MKDRTIGSEAGVTTIRGLPSCDYFDRNRRGKEGQKLGINSFMLSFFCRQRKTRSDDQVLAVPYNGSKSQHTDLQIQRARFLYSCQVQFAMREAAVVQRGELVLKFPAGNRHIPPWLFLVPDLHGYTVFQFAASLHAIFCICIAGINTLRRNTRASQARDTFLRASDWSSATRRYLTHKIYTVPETTSTKEEKKSAVTDHVARNNCVINWEGARVIDRRIRWIKEAVWIRKSTPVMNRDEGGYKISHVWDCILAAKAPPTLALNSGELQNSSQKL